MRLSSRFNTQNSCSADNIMVAAGDGDIAKVTQYLDSGVSPNAQDSNGSSALYIGLLPPHHRHAAASYGWLDILKLLVSRGGSWRVNPVKRRCDAEGFGRRHPSSRTTGLGDEV